MENVGLRRIVEEAIYTYSAKPRNGCVLFETFCFELTLTFVCTFVNKSLPLRKSPCTRSQIERGWQLGGVRDPEILWASRGGEVWMHRPVSLDPCGKKRHSDETAVVTGKVIDRRSLERF